MHSAADTRYDSGSNFPLILIPGLVFGFRAETRPAIGDLKFIHPNLRRDAFMTMSPAIPVKLHRDPIMS